MSLAVLMSAAWLTLVGTVIVLLVVVAIRLTRWPVLPASLPGDVAALLQTTRRRALLALVVAAAVSAVLIGINAARADLNGLPLMIAAPLGATGGLLTYTAAQPRPLDVDPQRPRVASLQRRTPLAVLGWFDRAGLAILTVASLGLFTFTGVTASPDEFGRYRMIQFGPTWWSEAAAPYAGWFYAVPAMLATLLLLAATWLTLRRTGTMPALPRPEMAGVDEAWRRSIGGIVAAVAATGLMVQLGGAASFSGISMGNALIPGLAVGWEVTSAAMLLAGSILLVLSVVTATLALVRAIRLPRRVRELCGVEPTSLRPVLAP